MNEQPEYYVTRERVGPYGSRVVEYLKLDGPFCYPAWISGNIAPATKFSFIRAHAFANAYTGEVVAS